jgi:hypothetical protein
MMNIGAKIQRMPAKYRAFLERNMELGEKAVSGNIFVLQQRDPQFREAWGQTGE